MRTESIIKMRIGHPESLSVNHVIVKMVGIDYVQVEPCGRQHLMSWILSQWEGDYIGWLHSIQKRTCIDSYVVF